MLPAANRASLEAVANCESQGDARDERLARNEVIFRAVNEAIEQQAIGFGGLDGYEFICECATASCFERVSLTLDEYERIRSEGATFFVLPGHVYDEIELVARRESTYWVVRKDGVAALVSEFADPRDGDAA